VAGKADVKHQAQVKADELKDQVSGKAKELREKAEEVTPDSAGKGIEHAQQVAQQNPVPLALVGTFLAGFVLGRLFSR
jgi:F0F1-type ATP synthase assembly protein I